MAPPAISGLYRLQTRTLNFFHFEFKITKVVSFFNRSPILLNFIILKLFNLFLIIFNVKKDHKFY